MNYLIAAIVGIVALIGGMFINPNVSNYDGTNPSESVFFGATNFPTSLDTLTNPASTDSVSTVSHSSQHANANDAVEALEAKVGITASTPFTGTVLVGDGTGTSLWSTYATTTNINTTNLEVSASSTIQDLTYRNATSTNATTTNLYSSGTASTTKFYGSNLTACTGSNFLNWTGGNFSCGASSATITSFSTTTSVAMATATIPTALIPSTDHLLITITSSTTELTSSRMIFNNDGSAVYTTRRSADGGAGGGIDAEGYIRTESENRSPSRINITNYSILNNNNEIKTGFFHQIEFATSTNASVLLVDGGFIWNNTSGRITQIDLGNVSGLWGTNTRFDIVGY